MPVKRGGLRSQSLERQDPGLDGRVRCVPIGRLLSRNVKRFRGGLVCKAHRLLYHSTLGLRVIKKKKDGWNVCLSDDADDTKLSLPPGMTTPVHSRTWSTTSSVLRKAVASAYGSREHIDGLR